MKILEDIIIELSSFWPRTIMISAGTATVVLVGFYRPELPLFVMKFAVGVLAGVISFGALAHLWALGSVSFGFWLAAILPPLIGQVRDRQPDFDWMASLLKALESIGHLTGGWYVLVPFVGGWAVGVVFRRRVFPDIM